jgi:putative sigma-54 modulation protein
MMNISVKSVHFRADEKLLTYVEKKISRLNRYFDRNVEAEIFLKLQDTGSKVQDKITEVKLHVPGGWVMDKKTGKTFESAINASVDTLKRQLTRHKERTTAFNGRGINIEE